MLTENLKKLSRSEKILLINDLWEDVADTADDLEISPDLADKLDHRYEAFVKNPDEGMNWKEFKSRFQSTVHRIIRHEYRRFFIRKFPVGIFYIVRDQTNIIQKIGWAHGDCAP